MPAFLHPKDGNGGIGKCRCRSGCDSDVQSTTSWVVCPTTRLVVMISSMMLAQASLSSNVWETPTARLPFPDTQDQRRWGLPEPTCCNLLGEKFSISLSCILSLVWKLWAGCFQLHVQSQEGKAFPFPWTSRLCVCLALQLRMDVWRRNTFDFFPFCSVDRPKDKCFFFLTRRGKIFFWGPFRWIIRSLKDKCFSSPVCRFSTALTVRNECALRLIRRRPIGVTLLIDRCGIQFELCKAVCFFSDGSGVRWNQFPVFHSDQWQTHVLIIDVCLASCSMICFCCVFPSEAMFQKW